MSKNVKIVCTVTTDLNNDQRMQRICTSLAHNGYDVLLVGRLLSRSLPLSDQSYQQKRLSCWFNSSFLFYVEYNIRLFFFLSFVNVDIFAPVDLDTILPSYVLHRLRRKRLVYDAHEYFTELPEIQERQFVKFVWSKIADFTLPHIENSYTVNQSLATIFEKKYNVPYGVIRNISRYNNDSNNISARDQNPQDKIVLYQGAINVGRGVEQAIRAMQYIEGCRLEIAGEGELSLEMKELVDQLELTNRVRFLGMLSPEQLMAKTHQAYIGLNLLEGTSQNYYYSLANKFFDYMHAGIPSINMDFPEYTLINKSDEVSVLISSLEPTILVDAINRLLHDSVFYTRLQSNAISARDKYNWESEEQVLLEVFRQVT